MCPTQTHSPTVLATVLVSKLQFSLRRLSCFYSRPAASGLLSDHPYQPSESSVLTTTVGMQDVTDLFALYACLSTISPANGNPVYITMGKVM